MMMKALEWMNYTHQNIMPYLKLNWTKRGLCGCEFYINHHEWWSLNGDDSWQMSVPETHCKAQNLNFEKFYIRVVTFSCKLLTLIRLPQSCCSAYRIKTLILSLIKTKTLFKRPFVYVGSQVFEMGNTRKEEVSRAL